MRRLFFSAFSLLVALGPIQTVSGAATIEFDYRFDDSGFFDDPQRRQLLELAADSVMRWLDPLEAIEPHGDNTWSLMFGSPAPSFELMKDPHLPADTLLVFVGGRGNMGSKLAQTDPGAAVQVSGDEAWVELVATRGQVGANDSPATNYGPWGGAIAFNKESDWYFGTDSAQIGDAFDFLTVAMHELVHMLGVGPAKSWKDQTVNGAFTGAFAQGVGSPNNPDLLLYDGGHWDLGTMSEVAGAPQTALMGPFAGPGQRFYLTDLDAAALRDIGWTPAAPGDVNRDGSVDSNDIAQILAADSFEQGEGFGWSAGDFTGNGRVTSDDIGLVLASGLFEAGPYAFAEPTQPAGFADSVVLHINDDGTAELRVPTEMQLNGFIIRAFDDDNEYLTGDATLPSGAFMVNREDEASSQFIVGNLAGTWNLGNLVDTDLISAADVLALEGSGFQALYTVDGMAGQFNMAVIPEPASLALLGLGGLLLLRRRRAA